MTCEFTKTSMNSHSIFRYDVVYWLKVSYFKKVTGLKTAEQKGMKLRNIAFKF